MAGTRCTVCSHVERSQIDLLIVEDRESIRSIAKRYGLSHTAVFRHKKAGHIPPALAIAKEKQDIAIAEQALAVMKDLLAEGQVLIEGARGNPEAMRKVLPMVNNVAANIVRATQQAGVAVGVQVNMQADIRACPEYPALVKFVQHLQPDDRALLEDILAGRVP